VLCVLAIDPDDGAYWKGIEDMYLKITVEVPSGVPTGIPSGLAREAIKRLVREFETSGLRRSEFCHKHNLALGTLQRGLRGRRMEVDGQSEGKRLVEVKIAGVQRNGSGPGICALEVVLAEGSVIDQRGNEPEKRSVKRTIGQ
jgi:hypothetical protein